MCEPNTIMMTLTAVNVIKTGTEIAAANSEAKAAERAANIAAYFDQLTLDEQQREAGTQTSVEEMERKRQTLRERGRILTALGEAGVGGNSPLREVANTTLQDSYDTGIMRENWENQSYRIATQKQGVEATRQSRVNAARATRIDPLAGALMIGGSAMSGFGAGVELGTTLFGPEATRTAIRKVFRG